LITDRSILHVSLCPLPLFLPLLSPPVSLPPPPPPPSLSPSLDMTYYRTVQTVSRSTCMLRWCTVCGAVSMVSPHSYGQNEEGKCIYTPHCQTVQTVCPRTCMLRWCTVCGAVSMVSPHSCRVGVIHWTCASRHQRQEWSI
jgi:hypothetical protein